LGTEKLNTGKEFNVELKGKQNKMVKIWKNKTKILKYKTILTQDDFEDHRVKKIFKIVLCTCKHLIIIC
jgi:hypothetical protein